jgi:hypothetical protein
LLAAGLGGLSLLAIELGLGDGAAGGALATRSGRSSEGCAVRSLCGSRGIHSSPPSGALLGGRAQAAPKAKAETAKVARI